MSLSFIHPEPLYPVVEDIEDREWMFHTYRASKDRDITENKTTTFS